MTVHSKIQALSVHRQNAHSISSLLEVADLFKLSMQFLSLEDLKNLSLVSRYFYTLTRTVPISVSFVDKISDAQLTTLEKWSFKAVNMRFKMNHESTDGEAPVADARTVAVQPMKGSPVTMSTTDFQLLKRICNTLHSLVNNNNQLETLMLTNLHFWQPGIINILRALKSKRSVMRLSIGSFKYEAPLSKEVAGALCELLRTNTNITEIGLKALNPECDETILHVLKSLHGTFVKQLSLHRDPITEPVGEALVPIFQRGSIESFRLLVFPGQSIAGCHKIFSALKAVDSIDRLLFGGCLNRRDTSFQKSLASYIQTSRKLKLLHLIDFSDWSQNLPLLLNALGKNTCLSILKFQFASKHPVSCEQLIEKLKPILMHHSSIEKITLENAVISAECYNMLAEVIQRNPRIKVVEMLNVKHDDNAEVMLRAMSKLRDNLMHNTTFRNFKVTGTNSFVGNSNYMILYYQILAVCTKNCMIQRGKKRKREESNLHGGRGDNSERMNKKRHIEVTG